MSSRQNESRSATTESSKSATICSKFPTSAMEVKMPVINPTALLLTQIFHDASLSIPYRWKFLSFLQLRLPSLTSQVTSINRLHEKGYSKWLKKTLVRPFHWVMSLNSLYLSMEAEFFGALLAIIALHSKHICPFNRPFLTAIALHKHRQMSSLVQYWAVTFPRLGWTQVILLMFGIAQQVPWKIQTGIIVSLLTFTLPWSDYWGYKCLLTLIITIKIFEKFRSINWLIEFRWDHFI